MILFCSFPRSPEQGEVEKGWRAKSDKKQVKAKSTDEGKSVLWWGVKEKEQDRLRDICRDQQTASYGPGIPLLPPLHLAEISLDLLSCTGQLDATGQIRHPPPKPST